MSHTNYVASEICALPVKQSREFLGSLTFEDRTDRFSRNVGKILPIYAV